MADTDGAITIVDSRNRTVTLTKPAKRIITLHDHLAEMIRILGAEDRIVGTDDRAIAKNPEFWPHLHDKPAVGGFNPNYERIVELKPDVVIAFASFFMEPFDKLERLEGTNIHLVAVDCYKIDTFDSEVRILGKVYVSTFGSVTNPIKIAYYAKTLYPNLFQDFDPQAFHKEWLEKWEGLDYRGVYFYPVDWAMTQLNEV